MYRRSALCRELQSAINLGRLSLAQQFSTMQGWQARESTRFDQYVEEKRTKKYFDGFDQRVERAYAVAARAHKTEIMNAFKRRLTSEKGGKFTAQTALDMRAAVDSRLHWLREVWSQIDADYRSTDPARQAVAAREISAALHGEPGDYMQWVYELKREERFMGPKGKAALQAQLDDAELPPAVSEDEVNRYHALRMNMAEVERQVKTKYGLAGRQHWAQLQAAKDAEYDAKLDEAAKVYEELLDQSARYDESRRTALLRSKVERVHQAQVRFSAAMALEREREKLVAAHAAMEQERRQRAKEQRIALHREAAEMRARGATSEAIRAAMQQRRLEMHAAEQAERSVRERDAVLAKKFRYLDLIEKLKADVEEREGRELLAQNSSNNNSSKEGLLHDAATASLSSDGLTPQRQPLAGSAQRQRPVSAFGFDERDRIMPGEENTHMVAGSAASDAFAASTASGGRAETAMQDTTRGATQVATPASKAALWDAIAADTYEDPFRTVHQARLDAAKTYDPLYTQFVPTTLAQGRRQTRQSLGEDVAGNGMDGEVMQSAATVGMPFMWGVQPGVVHDLDGDGARDYFAHTSWHVRDKETGDVDWRYERRKGGAAFRGPRFYRIGAERDARDMGEQTIDPGPRPWKPPSTAGGGAQSWRSS